MTIDRREFVASGLAGLGIASVGGVAHAGNGAQASITATVGAETAASSGSNVPVPHQETAPGVVAEIVNPRSAEFAQLLAPVATGATLAGSTVVRVEVDGWGRGTAELRTEDGAMFNVDVCSADPSLDHTAVATTDRYELFVRNGGDGTRATEQEVAHAVGALAEAIRVNEASAPVAVLTKSEYWARGC